MSHKRGQAAKEADFSECLLYLLLLCRGSVGSLVEALLSFIVAVFVEPDVLRGKALQSTHVGTGGKKIPK